MKKTLAVMMVVTLLAVCGAAVAEKTKKQTKTTTKTGPKTVWLTDIHVAAKGEENGEKGSGCQQSLEKASNNATIAGTIYDRALLVWGGGGIDPSEICKGFGVYDTGKKYDAFEASVGLSDDTDCQDLKTASVSFYGDGNVLQELSSIEKGQAQFVNFSLKNIRALKMEYDLEWVWDDGAGKTPHDCSVKIVIGDPKLIIGAPVPKKETTASTKTSTETTEVTETACDGSSNIIIDSKSLETLANNLAQQVNDAGLAKSGKVQLAITKFKLVSICKKSVADDVLDDLSTYLLKTKVFKLIEREQLEKAIKELKFNLTGFIEPKKAIELGKMVGAQAILIGSVSDRGATVMVNARIINTKTGEADIAENVEMKK